MAAPIIQLPVRMRVAPRERLHKIFVIHDAATPVGKIPTKEFRVFTKENGDGTLELLGYHYEFDGKDEHQSNVLRAPSVPSNMLITLIKRLVEQTNTDVEQMEVIDLTTCRTALDQADRLAHHELLEAFDFE